MYEYGEQQHHQPPPSISHGQAGRPLSFLPAARDEIQRSPPSPENTNDQRSFAARAPLHRTQSDKLPISQPASGQAYNMVGRSNSANDGHFPAPVSPALRSPAETAAASFPLNDIDYESSPAAVAQELSNLQAIRRMSMDVNVVGDPDLPSFSPTFGMPSIAPTGNADEDDASRLFWVPARLHPELAPKEFKTFLDSRAESIKRRSSEFSLSPDGPSRSGSEGGLRRKKSMLSRQIVDSDGKGAEGYQDGAERLDRKRSQSDKKRESHEVGQNLQELEMLMKDPSRVIQRLSLEITPQGDVAQGVVDMPILPAAPGGHTLKRSTRTTYRRGSLKKGERIPPSRRQRAAESDGEELSPRSPTSSIEPMPGITRVQTEPTRGPDRAPEARTTENFSRPGRRNRAGISPVTSPPPFEPKSDPIPPAQKSPPFQKDLIRSAPQPDSSRVAPQLSGPPVTAPPHTSREPRQFVSQIASNGRTTARLDQVPSIVETPPEESRGYSQSASYPDRKSSFDTMNNRSSSQTRGKRSAMGPQPQNEQQTLQHMAAHPSPLPGNSTRTDSLSFIPTLTEDKRALEPKKDAKKSGWSWGSLLGNEEKEKEKRKEEEAKEASKRAKGRLSKTDNTRLDLLQTTMEGTRGRESLVLDRGDMKLEEERKKESSRKSSEVKKEKDSSLFSSIFGGNKKKPDRESLGKKVASLRPLSPEPPRPVLIPDKDYNWTRFSILEERAIYRMAHIKLANPKRPLYSQVLLSNFMYSYLAKVQQMHPNVQIPQNAAQKRAQQQQQQQKKADQPEEFYQYQRYQEVS